MWREPRENHHGEGGGRAAGVGGVGEPPPREGAGFEGEEELLRDHRKEASPTCPLVRDEADADERERGRRRRMQPPPLPGVLYPAAGLEIEVERAGGEPSGEEGEPLGDVETREQVVRRRWWTPGSGGGGGRRSGRGGGGGTRDAGRRRGRERVRVGTDWPRLFGLDLQDFVVISENGRVFLQNSQQGRGSERCSTHMP
jgi:hypothetical protein